MRLAVTGTIMAALAALAYIASPFWMVWSLREAVRTGDTASIERMIEWDSVRTTLKASLARHAQLVPEIAESEAAIRPGLWQRVKIALGQSMIDSFVERAITPKGLSQLFEARKTYNGTLRRAPEADEFLGRIDRFKQFWARLKRAEFQSLTRVELEIEDRNNPARRIVSLLELRNFAWKLTALGVAAAPQMPAP